MNKLVALRFPDQVQTDMGIADLRKLHAGRSIKLYASALVEEGADGKLSVQEITKEGHGGAAVGALIGALAGLAAGPGAAAIMATGGALIGDAADLISEGDFSKFASSIAGEIGRGGAVVVAEVAEDALADFKGEMQKLGGTIIATS